tara:strand:+ start:4874 stop:5611 length:738 start_codon:yes stop_codon:yes gene_type:complete
MPKILRVIDNADKFHQEMPSFDIPFKLLINGKSQLSGKSTIVLNLLMNPEFGYDKKFDGENIYLVSDNKLDNKLKLLANVKEIPEQNIMSYDENALIQLYDDLEEDFLEDQRDGIVRNRIIVFDDCGYSGSLKNKQSGIISKLVCNGRHLNLSQIYTSQRFSQVSTTLRTNLTGSILFNTSMKELDLIAEDFNYLDSKKEFILMFRKYTKGIRQFLVVNFTNKDGMFMDSNFKTIPMGGSASDKP